LDLSIYFPIIILITVGFAVVVIGVVTYSKNRVQVHLVKRYHNRREIYKPGEFSSQMELDLRLPYRRFKKLYPTSMLTYEEYKQLQMQRSFRRSMSSQENKRMVR
jgi:hypothetical protein